MRPVRDLEKDKACWVGRRLKRVELSRAGHVHGGFAIRRQFLGDVFQLV